MKRFVSISLLALLIAGGAKAASPLQFERVAVELETFSVGRQDLVFGVRPGYALALYNGQTWLGVGGSLKQASMGCDGRIAGVNAQGGFFVFTGGLGKKSTWVPVHGVFKQAAVGHSDYIWALGQEGQPYQWVVNAFVDRGKKLERLSVGCDGVTWGLDRAGVPWRWRPVGDKGQWIRMQGKLVEISVAKGALVYGLDQQHRLVRWQGKAGWKVVGGKYAQVSASEDGTVWVKDFSKIIFSSRVFVTGPGELGRVELPPEPEPLKRPDQMHRLSKELKGLGELLIRERKRAGLPAFFANPTLNSVAQAHAEELKTLVRLEENPGGKTLVDRLKAREYGLVGAEQFLYQHGTGTKGRAGEEAFKVWFGNGKFRALIYDHRFVDVGLGLASDEKGNDYLVVILGQPIL